MDDSLGVQLEYTRPAETVKQSPAELRVTEQKATADLVTRWTEGAESISIGGAQGWVRRGVRNVDGTGTDSSALVLRDGTLVSVSSFTVSPEELIGVAASLETVPGGHAPLANPSVPARPAKPTPTVLPAPSFTALRPTWLPEQMKVVDQLQPDWTGRGTEVVIGFDPRPEDQKPHGVLLLSEIRKESAPPPAPKPDPGEIHETIAGRDVTIIMRGNDWITLSWVQGDVALTLTNPYDPPGHPRYTPEQLTRIVESVR